MRTGITNRILSFAVLLCVGGVAAFAVETPAKKKPAPKHPVRREYVHKTFGKEAIAPVVGGAAISQRKGSFGQHLATGFEGHVVKNTVEYGVGSLRHEDLHYHRSTKRGFGPRMRHALVSTVVTRKTTTGKKTVATGRISGAAAAGAVAGGAATGGVSLAADAGANVAREFWPRKKTTPKRHHS